MYGGSFKSREIEQIPEILFTETSGSAYYAQMAPLLSARKSKTD